MLAEDERLEDAVTDLLELARLDEGEGTPSSAAEVDLDEIVLEETVRTYRVPVDTTACRPVACTAAASSSARVVRNLLDNAGRHARARVAVALQRR